MELEILFEDQAVTVCRKPAGIPTQSASAMQEDMVSLLKKHYVAQGGSPYVGLIQRLDQPVEGILVFARTKEAAANLSAQVANHQTKKIYMAVTEGIWEQPEGELVDFLLKDGRTNKSVVVKQKTKDAKEARLQYKVVAVKDHMSLVRVTLLTGRHHQIRVQLANAGHGIVGDRKYKPVTGENGYMPLALCACEVGFCHPVTRKKMEFSLEPSGELFCRFSQ